MSLSLCIHGHFYQPPRENPWLGTILPEASAAPMPDWNERILRESYAPMAWARVLNQDGRIRELLNCYEWISFNVGPTLLKWMRSHAPELIDKMREGDQKSADRLGQGNAIAQIYHHLIMPLASRHDKELEVSWAIQDFQATFGRRPKGMWLSEAAVDLETLEVLAENDIEFVILAPRQARAVLLDGQVQPVDENSLPIEEAYVVSLPGGKSIQAVFYHGALSRAIAFESLLRDGERFWQRIVQSGRSSGDSPALLALSTDGETYGHHFPFGEMALAYVLDQGASQRDGIVITNITAFLATHPPTKEVLLHEPSSWSCVHGVERWRSDCGCTDGGHPGWNQQWRQPLRSALESARRRVSGHYQDQAVLYLTQPEAALKQFGAVLAQPDRAPAFAAEWFRPDTAGPGLPGYDLAWKMLAAQEKSLASLASCAWFFDDIARIEPENALTYAVRALELTGEPDQRDGLADLERDLVSALSNQPEKGNGADILHKDILTRRVDPATVALLGLLILQSEDRLGSSGNLSCGWPDLTVDFDLDEGFDSDIARGKAIIRHALETGGRSYAWEARLPSGLVDLTLPNGDGGNFVPLAKAWLSIHELEKGQEGRDTPDFPIAVTRYVKEFSSPLTSYLMAVLAQNQERRQRPFKLAQAYDWLSTYSPWPEEQHDLIRPELIHSLLPYIIVAAAVDPDCRPERCRQIRRILDIHASAGTRTLAGRILTEHILGQVTSLREEHTDDLHPLLTDIFDRSSILLPEMDLWPVQNALWDAGVQAFPSIAAKAGFAVS